MAESYSCGFTDFRGLYGDPDSRPELGEIFTRLREAGANFELCAGLRITRDSAENRSSSKNLPVIIEPMLKARFDEELAKLKATRWLVYRNPKMLMELELATDCFLFMYAASGTYTANKGNEGAGPLQPITGTLTEEKTGSNVAPSPNRLRSRFEGLEFED